MITGSVTGRRALVELELGDRGGQPVKFEFLLDTGFAGFLTLSPGDITALRLPFLYRLGARLADGSRIVVPVHEATVRWDGPLIDVEVLATGGDSLLGTALLDAHEVTISFADGALVTIQRL